MRNRHVITGKLKWLAVLVILAALLFSGAAPGYARVRVFIAPGIVVPFGPLWTPYWAPHSYPYGYPYAHPPVVVQPPPQVYALPPPPPPVWYYCENPQGYYPYVPQCPGGWRQVPARPP